MHIPFLAGGENDTAFPYYWGPIDSLHTFCERKYITHPQAAEFYNSCGSLIYCVAACIGLYHCRGTVWQVQCGWWSLLVVGVGSFVFHVMMRYNAELLDELPMLVLRLSKQPGFQQPVRPPYLSTSTRSRGLFPWHERGPRRVDAAEMPRRRAGACPVSITATLRFDPADSGGVRHPRLRW